MIADPPVSDLKAKAEARRAKILAREAARLSAAKGEKVSERNCNWKIREGIMLDNG